MSTNPRIPESRGPQLERGPGGLPPVKPKSGTTGVTLAIIVALLLLGAVFYFMPRAPRAAPPRPGAEVPQQPTPGQIQLQNVNMAKAPTGGSVELDGIMTNSGPRTINGIAVDVVFQRANGTIAGNQEAPIMGLKKEGSTLIQDDLVKNPIKPGDTRPFRVTVDRVPQGWNNEMPALRIVTVTSHP